MTNKMTKLLLTALTAGTMMFTANCMSINAAEEADTVVTESESGTYEGYEEYSGLAYIDDNWVYLIDGVKDTEKTGLVLYDEEWFYVKNGEMDATKSGLVEYNGGWFWVAAGRICREANGPTLSDVSLYWNTIYDKLQVTENKECWLYMADGQVQLHYTGLAEYDGEWFYLEHGRIQSKMSGLIPYDGNAFWVADGRVLSEHSGLMMYGTEKGGYIADGRLVEEYSGLVEYNRGWFYVKNGVFQVAYTGYMEHNGEQFFVIEGQLVNSTENLPEENKMESYLAYLYALNEDGTVKSQRAYLTSKLEPLDVLEKYGATIYKCERPERARYSNGAQKGNILYLYGYAVE